MKPTHTYTALIWRGHELAFIETSDDLRSLVQWASQQIRIDVLAGYTNTTANITPSGVET